MRPSSCVPSTILAAQFKKNKVKPSAEPEKYRGPMQVMVGYSNADIEAIVLLAADYAGERGADEAVTPDDLARAARDYLPSRDVEMIEYMELLAVFEASNRRMLPAKYADLSIEELQARLKDLRVRVGYRR